MLVIDITAVLSFIDHTRVYTYNNESVIDSITAVEYLRGFNPIQTFVVATPLDISWTMYFQMATWFTFGRTRIFVV